MKYRSILHGHVCVMCLLMLHIDTIEAFIWMNFQNADGFGVWKLYHSHIFAGEISNDITFENIYTPM